VGFEAVLRQEIFSTLLRRVTKSSLLLKKPLILRSEALFNFSIPYLRSDIDHVNLEY